MSHWFSRRSFLQQSVSCTFAMQASKSFGQAENPKTPITGKANRDLEAFDQMMSTFINENQVPGASLAISKAGKLVYARGFGFADIEAKTPVEPLSLFRIASVSKPITGVAILQLVQEKKIGLDDRVVSLMKLKPHLPEGSKLDSRWEKITVRQCLQHTGGWDRDKSYDPIGRPMQIAKALAIEPPVNPEHIIRYMMGQPLDFDPGERYAYSNLGYLILGRIIEKISGVNYQAFVKKNVLTPLGIKSMQLGKALIENRLPNEVTYYDHKKRTGSAVYPPKVGQRLPIQYGVANFEAYEAHGGWIANAVDLVKFACAFDEPERCPILAKSQIEEISARPTGSAGTNAKGVARDSYYGAGWSIRKLPDRDRFNAFHSGFIPGTEALLVRRWDHLNWAVLFNISQNHEGKNLVSLIDGKIHSVASAITKWPDDNQFNTL